MTQIGIVVAMVATFAQGSSADSQTGLDVPDRRPPPALVPLREAFAVQFAQSLSGRTVRVLLDGRILKTTTAGKLAFRDRHGAGVSVCADVRAPIARGMGFVVTPFRSSQFGGNVAKAGNIVARWFRGAQSADECAGLQLAVWEAIEDGGQRADFGSGRFRVQAGAAALAFAQKYYSAANEPGEALYLQAGPGGGHSSGQSQVTTAL